MSWLHIAHKDFEDAIRSMTLWALTGLLILLIAGGSAIPYLIATDGSSPTFEEAMVFLFTPIGLLVPIIGLIVSYQAIVGERESGSIRFLLGLPNTRRDVIVGKVLGRSAVVAVPTVIGFIVGAIVVAVLYDGFVITEYIGLMLFTILMGLVYVAIGVSVSASVSSRAKAVAGVLGIFVISNWLWGFVPMAIYWLLEGRLPGPQNLPAWYLLVERLSIGEAISVIALTFTDFIGTENIDMTTAGRLAGNVPFYLENWFVWIFVLAWVVIPLGIGYYRFNRAVLS